MMGIGKKLLLLLLCAALGLSLFPASACAESGGETLAAEGGQRENSGSRSLCRILWEGGRRLGETAAKTVSACRLALRDPWGELRTASLNRQLRILVIGNSFNQDVMAYVPPILNEILPDYEITYAVLYVSSADLDTHLERWESGSYTLNYWGPLDTRWSRGEITLSDALAIQDWDIIMTQATSSDVLSEERIRSKIIEPGRQLLRILQANAPKPFAAMWFQWVGRPEGDYGCKEMTRMIMSATDLVMKEMGFLDYIPVGAAIQSARTNPALNALGGGGEMLHSDGIHLAAGLPDLIAAYTVVQKILQWTGNGHLSVLGSGFRPTDANCIRIGARNEGVKPIRMTHGDASGVTEELVLAAQEIAVLAVKFPGEITDCSGILG